MNKFDTQIHCEEFYSAEVEIPEERVVVQKDNPIVKGTITLGRGSFGGTCYIAQVEKLDGTRTLIRSLNELNGWRNATSEETVKFFDSRSKTWGAIAESV